MNFQGIIDADVEAPTADVPLYDLKAITPSGDVVGFRSPYERPRDARGRFVAVIKDVKGREQEVEYSPANNGELLTVQQEMKHFDIVDFAPDDAEITANFKLTLRERIAFVGKSLTRTDKVFLSTLASMAASPLITATLLSPVHSLSGALVAIVGSAVAGGAAGAAIANKIFPKNNAKTHDVVDDDSDGVMEDGDFDFQPDPSFAPKPLTAVAPVESAPHLFLVEETDGYPVRIGFDGEESVPEELGLFRHADGALSTEAEVKKSPSLLSRLAPVGASLREIGTGLVEYGVTTAKGVAAIIPSVAKFFKSQPKEAIVTEFVEDDELVLSNHPKLTLRDRVRAVSQNLKQHSEALSTMAVSVGIGAGAKLALATAVGASTALVIPAAAAFTLSMAMRGRKNWRAAQIEQNKENLYQQKLAEGGLLELKATTEDERRAEFFNTVSRAEYDDRANYGFLKNVGATMRDLVRPEVIKSITARDVGYALGAGLTAGVASYVTGLLNGSGTNISASVDPELVAPQPVPTQAPVEATAPVPAPVVETAPPASQPAAPVEATAKPATPRAHVPHVTPRVVQPVTDAAPVPVRSSNLPPNFLEGVEPQPESATTVEVAEEPLPVASASEPVAPVEVAEEPLPVASASEPVAPVEVKEEPLPAAPAPAPARTEISKPIADINSIRYDVAGFDPNGDSMAQCFAMTETCEAVQNKVADGNELVRFQDGNVAVDVRMEKGQTLNGFLSRQFARWSEIRGQLDTLKTRIRSGQAFTPDDVGAGQVLRTATGQTLAGRAPPTPVGGMSVSEQFAGNAQPSPVNDNSGEPLALNNRGGTSTGDDADAAAAAVGGNGKGRGSVGRRIAGLLRPKI